jgi:hypothetical protein
MTLSAGGGLPSNLTVCNFCRIAESKGKLAAQAVPTQEELEERKAERLQKLEEEQEQKRR